ncbi:hypothetical protein UlMin_025212 [Ulmus minor]
MVKKMKLPGFLSKNKEAQAHQWQWTLCNHPRTLSFRIGDDMIKTVNSVFFDPKEAIETPESWFTNSAESSTESDDFDSQSLESVVRGARSERLFFEPGSGTSSILDKSKKERDDDRLAPFKESVVLAMESEDPYEDFRKSMEEMVEVNGVKDWESLEELLGWYLRNNGKNNHGFIVGAFVDLLVVLANANNGEADSTSITSYSSAISSFCSSSSSPTLCLRKAGLDDIDEEEIKSVNF